MKKVFGAVIFVSGLGFGVAFTWLKIWTPGLVWVFGGLLAFGAFLIDPDDIIAFIKAIPTRFTVSS